MPYPAPPGLVTSPDFTVTVNGVPVWVEKISSVEDSGISGTLLPQGLEMEALNAVSNSGWASAVLLC